jgi:hypothetical protein
VGAVSFWKRERLRERAALAGRVTGALLLSLGLLVAYANRVLFDADAFADRAAASLGDPRVAGFVGERIAKT